MTAPALRRRRGLVVAAVAVALAGCGGDDRPPQPVEQHDQASERERFIRQADAMCAKAEPEIHEAIAVARDFDAPLAQRSRHALRATRQLDRLADRLKARAPAEDQVAIRKIASRFAYVGGSMIELRSWIDTELETGRRGVRRYQRGALVNLKRNGLELKHQAGLYGFQICGGQAPWQPADDGAPPGGDPS
jgi:hypothetical protein